MTTENDVVLTETPDTTSTPISPTASALKEWFLKAGVRAIKTFAEVALITIGSSYFDIITADWWGILSMSVGGAIVSMLISLKGIPEVADGESLFRIA